MPKVEDYYQRLFEDAPIGIYRSTPGGKIIDANKTLVSMLGYPDLQSLMEVNIADLYVDPQKRVDEKALATQTSKINFFEFQLRRADGEIISVRDTMRVIRDASNNTIYYEGVLEDITERVRAEQALQESQRRADTERAQRRLAETLREIFNIITSTLDFEEVIQQIFVNLERLIPFDSSTLMLLQDEQLRIVGSRGIPNLEQLKSTQIELANDPLSNEIIKTKQPIFLENATEDPRFQNYGKAQSIKSWLGVPLIARDQVIGMLTLDSSLPGLYSESEIQIAFTLTSQIAVAVENARLFAAEQRRANVMSALRATLADISTELDLTTLLQSILKRAITLIDATGGELAIYDETKHQITVAACHNMDKDFTGKRLKPGAGAIGQVVVSGEPLVIDDYRIWEGHLPNFASRPWVKVIAVPLKIRERTLGVIALVSDETRERQFDETDLRTLTLFAQQATIAIENAEFFSLITSALTNSQTLYRIARTLIATENLSDLLKNLVEEIASALPADRVILITLDLEKQDVTHYVIGGPDAHWLEPASFQELMDGLTGWVIRERQSANSPHSPPDFREQAYVREYRNQTQTKALIVVPLLYHQQILGTLTAINSTTTHDYTQTEVDLLETIASHVALAIKNAQLFEKVQQLAETDDLTQINNRRQLFNLGEYEFSRANRYQEPLSVIMLDIDHFKKINDSYGHAVGDIVLHALAQHCKKNIRDVDIVGRYGGEEFVIVLPNTLVTQGHEIAERLREQIANTPISTKIGPLKITISLGVAEMSTQTPNLAALIDRADTALYKAKNAGRNRVEIIGKQKNDDIMPGD